MLWRNYRDICRAAARTGWSTWELFVVEALGMTVIAFVVRLCLSVQRLVFRALDRRKPGRPGVRYWERHGWGLNPARQFGPAVVSGQTRFCGFLAPCSRSHCGMAATEDQCQRRCLRIGFAALSGFNCEGDAMCLCPSVDSSVAREPYGAYEWFQADISFHNKFRRNSARTQSQYWTLWLGYKFRKRGR